jgi:hypothetical protein
MRKVPDRVLYQSLGARAAYRLAVVQFHKEAIKARDINSWAEF